MNQFYYEIRNSKTQERAGVFATNFSKACEQLSCKARDCHLVWKAEPENAGEKENY